MKTSIYLIAITFLTSLAACTHSDSNSPAAAPTTIVTGAGVHVADSGASGDERQLLTDNLPDAVSITGVDYSWNKGLYNVRCHFVRDVATRCSASTTSDGQEDVKFSKEQAKAVGYVLMSNVGDQSNGAAGATEIKAGLVVVNLGGDEALIQNVDILPVTWVPNSNFSPDFFKLERKLKH